MTWFPRSRRDWRRIAVAAARLLDLSGQQARHSNYRSGWRPLSSREGFIRDRDNLAGDLDRAIAKMGASLSDPETAHLRGVYLKVLRDLYAPLIDGAVPEATPESGAALFDARARRLFGISGKEWLRRYDAGEFADADHSKVTTMEMLIPFARSSMG